METVKYALKGDGVFVGEEKIAHVNGDGSFRMLAGKSDQRDDVEAFLKSVKDAPNGAEANGGTGEAPDSNPNPGAAVEHAEQPRPPEKPVVQPTPATAQPAPAVAPVAQPVAEKVSTAAPRNLTPTPATAPQARPVATESQPAIPGSLVCPFPGAPNLGDKDPEVKAWYRENDPVAFARKYPLG